MVEVQFLGKDDARMSMIVQGVDASLMNALRRIVLAEVPAMAVDEVVVVENSSLLHDEILAHRLGLVPLRTDLDGYNLPEECPCKSEFGCNLCRAVLTLEVEASEGVRTVYSGDLKPENPNIAPVSDRIPLVKLAPGQRIRLEAYARLGRGKSHAKWQPVSASAYKNLPRVTVDGRHCDACGKCVEVCPKGVLIRVGDKVEVRNPVECILCRDCVEACPMSPPAVELTWDPEVFVWNIESTGALPPERIVLEAFSILEGKLSDFRDRLKEAGRGAQEGEP